MKRLLLYFIAIQTVCVLITACKNNKTDRKIESYPYKSFYIMRGTNIAHWLSQSDRRGDERKVFFTEKDIRFIDSIGFDHIRLPIDEEQMWDETGKRHEDAFALLKSSLEWCQKAGLRVVVDLHILRSHHFNAKEKPLWTVPAEQDKFITLWKDLSGFLHEWPNAMMAYEFMNEPVADDPEQWNSLLARVVDSLRKWEPERVLVIGSNRWQSANTFDQLKVPEKDTNIILSFHFYEPFFLTHYQASWTDLKDFKGDITGAKKLLLSVPFQKVHQTYTRTNMWFQICKILNENCLPIPEQLGEDRLARFGAYREFE